MIHLDTSFLIRALLAGSSEDALLRGWLAEGESMAMSTVAWAEFLCGPVTPIQAELAKQIIVERIPFTPADAERTAELFNASGRRRGTLADCMIAATALNHRAPIATSNGGDPQRFADAGLLVRTPA